MKIGDTVKLIKKTFMHNGIFVLTNSIVEISSISGNDIEVIYSDREGHKHCIKNLTKEDISPL